MNKRLTKGFGLFFLAALVTLTLFPATSQDETGGEESAMGQWKETQMPINYQNIQVPREFWQFTKEILRADGVSEQILEDFAVLPVAIRADIHSPEPRILKDGVNHRAKFFEGGGVLDLFDYVSGKGSFHIRFSPEIGNEGVSHLIYISDSPGKDVDGVKWGNGCGKMYDLTEKMANFAVEPGIKVTSSKRHYLHLMSGTFVFMQLVDERLFLGYIQLTDSRYPKFNCHSA